MKFIRAAIGLLLFVPLCSRGQIVIGSNVQMSASGTPDVVFRATSDITNGSSYDFAGTNLIVNLAGGDQQITGVLVVRDLNVGGGGTKHINRAMTVTNSMTFESGIVIPRAKLLYTGAGSDINGASESSYVSGPFSAQSNGRLTFPIGMTTVGYAPAYVEDGSETHDVTMQVMGTGAGLAPATGEAELAFVDNTHYWQITTTHPDGVTGLNSRVTLSTTHVVTPSELSPVVVEASATNSDAINLSSSSVAADAVTSRLKITQPFLAVGGSIEVDLVIHDMITPFTKGDANDYLYIQSIEKFDYNKVTLLDRWGVPVKEWKNFTNYDDPVTPNTDGYDFAKLSPGNYICLVEYGFTDGPRRKKSQMVTVLKSN